MEKKIVGNILIIFICSFFFLMCKNDIQNNEGANNEADFVVYHMDTLSFDEINKIKFKYTNKEFESYPKRYLDIYYIIQDSLFDGKLEDLEKYQFGLLEDAGKFDTLDIGVFHEKGDKYVTFFVYDEVQIPVSKDSINLKYVVTKFGARTFIK